MPMPPYPGDEALMMRALALAERARGLTSPNPLVGALVVKDGVVVGEGYHARAGAPHAERVALTAAGPRARVVVAVLDPNPRVNGARTDGFHRPGPVSFAPLDNVIYCKFNGAFFTWVTE